MQQTSIKVTKLSENKVATGKWISFYQASYSLSNGQKIDNWEFVKREQDTTLISQGVETIPILKNKKNGLEQLILIANFRCPVGNWVIEFPAGLLEPNETPKQAAQREFEEETGFKKFKFLEHCNNQMEQICQFDPWKSTETNINFVIEVEEESREIQNLDNQENIEVFFLDFDGKVLERLKKYAEEKNYLIAQDVWMFLLGFSLASSKNN